MCKGSELVSIAELRLPVNNSKVGKSQTLHRLATCCSQFLPKDYPFQRIGKLSKPNFSILRQAADNFCTTSNKFELMKAEILRPIDEYIQNLDPLGIEAQKNTEVNRTALLAWLLIYPPANAWWEKLSSGISEAQRPTFLEQPGGPGNFRLQIYTELIRVSEEMKISPSGIDDSLFDPSVIGTDAANACKRIFPRAGIFKDGESLRDAHTSLVNRYKSLEQRVYSSGFSKGNWSKETYERAYLCVGEGGKTRDIGLFYSFVVFSKHSEDIQWIVRDFADTIGQSSSSTQNETNNNSSSNQRVSRKEDKEVARLERIVSAVAKSFTPAKRRQEDLFDLSDVGDRFSQEEKVERVKFVKIANIREALKIWQEIAKDKLFKTKPQSEQDAINSKISTLLQQLSELV